MKPNGIEAMMLKMQEVSIQLSQNISIAQANIAALQAIQIQQREVSDRLEQRMSRIEQKIDALPEEVWRKQVGFTPQPAE